jgi:very-short-patch-repair endonuclease
MGEIIVASEALATGLVTRQLLRTGYQKIHQNIYAPTDFILTADRRAVAAWLWSGRRATLTGLSAAAVLGSKWLPDTPPAELGRVRQPSPRGIVIHSGAIGADELTDIGEMRCTTAPRTGYDLGRRLPFETAVIRIDTLLNATGCHVEDVVSIGERYPGARGIRRLRTALQFVDAGSESPQETRLRLLIVASGLPRPQTQIPVTDQWGVVRRRIDMGWSEWMVGVEYDGEQHWTNSRQHAADIERLEFLAARGWTIIRVSRDQLRFRPDEVIARIRNALHAAGCPV